MTCWRRLRGWQQTGVWDALHQVLLDRLEAVDQLDWERALVGASSIPAHRGPSDWVQPGRPGQTWHHAPLDHRGPGTAAGGTGDQGQPARVGCVRGPRRCRSPIRCPRGQRRTRPEKLHAAKACDMPRCRRVRHRRGIGVRIARVGIEPKGTLGRHRWVIARTVAWLRRFRPLAIRSERRLDIHQTLLTLGCALICFRALERSC